MKLWIHALAITGLVGALAVSTASAQEEEWFDDDDDALVILDEHLEDLGWGLARAFQPDFSWTDDDCEDEDECTVRFSIDGDEHYLIVNGDTVKSGHGPMPYMRDFKHKFGQEMGRHGHGPRFDFHANMLGPKGMRGDSVLRKLERESRRIAKKARSAEGSEKDDLEKELDQKLNEIFDYKLERQEKAIGRAEKHLSKLKERRSKRASAKDDIIQNRKDELLGNARYLEW